MTNGRRWRAVALVLLLLVCTGCLGPSARESYVAADRATHDAFVPEYLGYVETDTEQTEREKKLRRDSMAAWRIRLEAEEQAIRRGR